MLTEILVWFLAAPWSVLCYFVVWTLAASRRGLYYFVVGFPDYSFFAVYGDVPLVFGDWIGCTFVKWNQVDSCGFVTWSEFDINDCYVLFFSMAMDVCLCGPKHRLSHAVFR